MFEYKGDSELKGGGGVEVESKKSISAPRFFFVNVNLTLRDGKYTLPDLLVGGGWGASNRVFFI